MKKLYPFLFALLFLSGINAQPCLPEGITFSTQAQIDSFQINYPSCTEIMGDVIIGGSNSYPGYDITNLNGLSVVTNIRGDLNISYIDTLTNLTGLDGLTSIGGNLRIGGSNHTLTSLSGLEGLTFIGGNLSIYGNIALTNLVGLENVTSIGGDVNITTNNTLTSFTGLDNLATINGGLIILGNNILSNLTGLENLTSIGGDLYIRYNDSLASLTGIDNIEASSIDSLYIVNNSSLSTCEVQSICNYLASPNGTVDIRYNASGCNSPPEVANVCGLTLPCLPYGPYYFFSQTDIDNFQSNYPGCTQLEGNVQIGQSGGSDITNLNGLNVVTSIGGELWILNNNALTDLSGLGNLDSIGRSLYVGGNNILTSLTGLDNVTSIGGFLSITGSDNLTNLTGLDNLTSIGGALDIRHNDSLTSLMGLDNVTSLGSYFSLIDNNALTSLTGLEGLNSIADGLWIENNNSLPSLSGLDNVDTIGGRLHIMGNDSLINLAGLGNLISIGDYVSINNNDALTNLTGLNNLTSIGGELWIYENALTSLTGLEGLNSIGGGLWINGNSLLTSLTGIDNVEASSIDSLYIVDNSSLSTCEVQSICDYLANPTGTVMIFNNATGCNNPPEVAIACGFTLPCLPYGPYYFFSQADVDNFQTNYPGCTQLEGNVEISGNDITNLDGLSVVTSIASNYGNYFLITVNDNLTNLSGLSNLSYIGGSFRISYNISLTSLSGLDNLDSIGGSLHISENLDLISLSGLDNLNLIEGYLNISHHPELISLSGLDNIDASSIDNLYINNNASLSFCEVQSVCDYLEYYNDTVSFNNNATGCNSQQEVEDACGIVVIDEVILKQDFLIYPNPSHATITIELPAQPSKNTSLTISNTNGQQLITQAITEPQTEIDISHMPTGIYIVKIWNDKEVLVQKMIKQ